MKLIIGAGNDRINGYTTLDIRPECNPDILWDLEKTPFPIDTNQVTELVAKNVIEHINATKFPAFINECYRIMVGDALFHIETPYGVSYERLMDPSHAVGVYFVEHTWEYLSPAGLQRLGLYPGYWGLQCNFHVISAVRHGPNMGGFEVVLQAQKLG